MAMADELHTRDVAHTDLLSEISLLRAAKESLEAENQKLTQHVEDLNQDLKDAYLKIDAIKGAAKPLSKDRMPDAHSTRIPESRKIYFRFEMTDVDNIGQTEAQNIIKNVCLQTGTRFSNLEKRLAKLVKAKQNEQVYTNFANGVHRVLYKRTCSAGQNASRQNRARPSMRLKRMTSITPKCVVTTRQRIALTGE